MSLQVPNVGIPGVDICQFPPSGDLRKEYPAVGAFAEMYVFMETGMASYEDNVELYELEGGTQGLQLLHEFEVLAHEMASCGFPC